MIAVNERDCGGGALAVPAAIIMLALVLCLGLGVDGVRKAQLLATAAATAEEAARAGGQELDTVALRRGLVALDPDLARAAALEYLAEAGVTGTVEFADGAIGVRVTATRRTAFLGLMGLDEVTAEGYGEARPVLIPSGGGG